MSKLTGKGFEVVFVTHPVANGEEQPTQDIMILHNGALVGPVQKFSLAAQDDSDPYMKARKSTTITFSTVLDAGATHGMELVEFRTEMRRLMAEKKAQTG